MKNIEDKNTAEVTVGNFKYSKENEELVKNGFWAKTKYSLRCAGLFYSSYRCDP
jgi:hypothetical protein